MVPHAALLQPAPPITFHVTAVFVVPVTAAVNCCVLPSATVVLFGLTLIVTGPAEFVGSEGLLLAVVKPAHPERYRLPEMTMRKSTKHS
jgi:hypothetical protein